MDIATLLMLSALIGLINQAGTEVFKSIPRTQCDQIIKMKFPTAKGITEDIDMIGQNGQGFKSYKIVISPEEKPQRIMCWVKENKAFSFELGNKEFAVTDAERQVVQDSFEDHKEE